MNPLAATPLHASITPAGRSAACSAPFATQIKLLHRPDCGGEPTAMLRASLLRCRIRKARRGQPTIVRDAFIHCVTHLLSSGPARCDDDIEFSNISFQGN